ncbi:hypothetical protein PGTUg99_004703 [Puccinia graminis f. sp. tritici]|uniref:Uncharacterized protein n=1 Tax=Puccinia graminis f. sp. tritici TaxID=56615 RepID=A0A5B0SEG6_PUCGR|nr:hypothetical protein PGTUg99_004703 [Puccinia graminis f. sp. tritici]
MPYSMNKLFGQRHQPGHTRVDSRSAFHCCLSTLAGSSRLGSYTFSSYQISAQHQSIVFLPGITTTRSIIVDRHGFQQALGLPSPSSFPSKRIGSDDGDILLDCVVPSEQIIGTWLNAEPLTIYVD